ncbi:MAG: putative damage-inducible protein DinB [Sphingobacteriales bacterium]|jgi:uncharacterized damage-inducible protein DinB
MEKNLNPLVQMAGYNCWANARIQEMILKLEKGSWGTEVTSSFSSLKDTILHIWDAEVVWSTRMHGEPIQNWPSKDHNSTCEVTLINWLKFNQEFKEYAQSLTVKDWNQSVKYTTIANPLPNENTREFMFRHCMNHSSYHRGQIITLLRQLGLKEILSTDLLVYGREN